MGFSTAYGASAQYFGHEDYYAAKRDGAKDSDILSFLQGNPGVLRGSNSPGGGGLFDEIYRNSFQENLNSYKQQLEEQTGALKTQLSEAQNQLTAAQSERDAAKAAAEEARSRAETEKEIAVGQQLGNIRTGTTVSGSAGPGIGDTASGRPALQGTGDGKARSLLDRAYDEMDPTDSVLDKKTEVGAGVTASRAGSGIANRAQARQRAMASGGGASGYYARRFG